MSQQPQSAANLGDRWAAFRGLRWWQLALSLLPMALIAVGGMIGGAVGGLGMWANLRIARSALHGAVKALLMLLVVGAAYVVWLVVAVAIKSLLAS